MRCLIAKHVLSPLCHLIRREAQLGTHQCSWPLRPSCVLWHNCNYIARDVTLPADHQAPHSHLRL